MKPRRVVFRVDASPIIGLGHLLRCLSLAQGLTEYDVRVVFVIRQSSLPYCAARRDWVGETLCIPSISATEEQQWLAHVCHDLAADWLILDGYQFDISYRQALAKYAINLGMFDDGQLLTETHSNRQIDSQIKLVINWATQAEHLPYCHVAPNALLCAGEGFRVLRQEFYKLPTPPWLSRQGLLLMFGGSDPLDLTLPLLTLFCQSAIRVPITVVTGAAYQQLPALQDVISNSKLAITHLHDCQNLAQVLGDTRLAISAAGASQYELLGCATPSILAVVAENQRFASEQAAKQGWCRVLDYDPTQPANSIKQLFELGIGLWHQAESLASMHHQAGQFQAEMGIKRIITRLYPLPSQTIEQGASK